MHGRLPVHVLIAALAAATAGGLAACAVAQTTDGTNSFLVGRGQYRFYSCVQLATQVASQQTRERELLALIAKAKQGPGGGLVSSLSYEPDLAVARGQLAELRREQTEKNCPEAAPTRPSLPSRRGN